MRLSADECQILAQIAPVLLLAIFVDRRDVARLVDKTVRRRQRIPWLFYVRAIMVLLLYTTLGAVTHVNDGTGRLVGFTVTFAFWAGVGGVFMMMWELLGRAARQDD